jgi:hypothetical protein
MRGGALVLVTIALFATDVMLEEITALAFFVLPILLAVAHQLWSFQDLPQRIFGWCFPDWS